MGAVLPFLEARDPRWVGRCRDIVELVSVSTDQDATAVGTSPFQGDLGVTGVRVPAAATTAQTNRYLIRLCGVQIPQGGAIILRGLRQLATIRASVTLQTWGATPLEREVVSPLWSFWDGNVSWHLRKEADRGYPRRYDAAQVPGNSPNLRGLGGAVLYVPPFAPYTAPNGGQPPGRGIGELGTMRDNRFPWERTAWSLEDLIPGPGRVVLYASVHQPDPTLRPDLDPLAAQLGMRPEDQFLAAYPRAIYGRVAGAMTVEVLPCCEVAND